MNFDLDIAMFLIFLAVTLFVGLRYSRDIKNIEDYALGGRNFSTTAIVATILATWIGGKSFAVGMSEIYSQGLNHFIPRLFMCLQVAIVGIFLVPRMSEFLGKVSVADAMGSLYGKKVRIITAICGIASNVGGIAVQFKVFGGLFNYFLGVSSDLAIMLSAIIVIFYSAFGGIRAVTHTDVLQATTFTLAIPIVAIIVWSQISHSEISYSNITNNPNFDIAKIFNIGNPDLLGIAFLMIYFAVPSLSTMDFQRIALGKNIAQVKRAFLIAAILFAVVQCMIALTPLLLLAINPDIKPNNIMSYIINNYTFTGLKGLIIIGVAALSMSTADSRINAASVLFANDLKEFFNLRINKLLLSKLFSLGLGVFALYFALSDRDLFSMVVASASFYMPVVSVPLVLSILGFRSSSKSVLIAMIGGITFITIWKLLGIKIDGIVPGMVLNGLLLFGTHYLLGQPGGWIDTRDKEYYKEKQNAKKIFKKQIKRNIENFSFVKFCINNALHNDVNYTLFGVFGFITSIAIMYALPAPVHFDHSQILIILYQSMMVISNFFLLYLVWSPKVKNRTFVSIVWNISVVHLLCFCSTFFLLLSNFHKLVLVVFIVDIIVMFSLVKWRVAIPMIILGTFLGTCTYLYYIQIEGINFPVDFGYSDIIYIILLISTVFITIIKPAQFRQELIEQKVGYQKDQLTIQKAELEQTLGLKYEFLRNLQHETNSPLSTIKGMIDLCYVSYDKLNDADRKKCLENAYDGAVRLCSYVSNITDLSKLTSMNYKFNMEEVDIEELIYERVQACKTLYMSYDHQDHKKQHEFVYDIEDIKQNIKIKCDKYYITQVIDNIITNAMQYSDGGKITIHVKYDEESITVSVQDEGIGIAKKDLYDIFGAFVVGSTTKTPAGGRGVGLALCKKIITLHEGRIWAQQNPDKGSKIVFILPK